MSEGECVPWTERRGVPVVTRAVDNQVAFEALLLWL
jgi:hypothetical protein